MRLPTANRLARIGIDRATAKGIRRALETAFADPEGDLSTSDHVTNGLTAADEILQKAGLSHGVEYIGHSDDSQHEVWGIEYVNMGDTYRVTLLFDHYRNQFDVCSWGDIVETAAEGAYP